MLKTFNSITRSLSILGVRIEWNLRARLDKFMLRLASRLPARLRYWVVVDSFGRATTGEYSMTEAGTLTVFEMQKRVFPS